MFCFTCLALVGGICGVFVVVWGFVGVLFVFVFVFIFFAEDSYTLYGVTFMLSISLSLALSIYLSIHPYFNVYDHEISCYLSFASFRHTFEL